MNESEQFIKFLGTGAGDFYQKRDKPGDTGGKDVRHAPSLFVSPNVLIDFFDDGQLTGFSIPREAIGHLLITHGHYDHFRPTNIHALACSLPEPLRVYGSATIMDGLDFASRYRWNRSNKTYVLNNMSPNLQKCLVEPGTEFSIDDMKVTPVLANHCMDKDYDILQQRVLNYVIERGGRTLYYGLDCSYPLPGMLEELAGFRFDIAVFDATYGPREIDTGISGHLNWAMLDETIGQFREAGLFAEDVVIVASHISVVNVEPYDEIVDTLIGKGITMSYDGLTLPF